MADWNEFADLVGEAPSFRTAVHLLRRIAETDAPVLIEGETGTGKELAARAIHYTGRRRDMPFVPVNCGAIPDGVFEAELFGHRRGAFTDAKAPSSGLVGQAQSGTLFLDEVEALSPKAQTAMLRFLQDLCYRPIGGGLEQRADVRVIAATNCDLPALAARHEFRMDLMFRLRIVTLTMPPLRERPGDARILAQHFVRRFARQYARPAKPIAPASLAWLSTHSWPGNVRELENLVHRGFLLADGDEIRLGDAPAERGAAAAAPVLSAYLPFELGYRGARTFILAELERAFATRALTESGGNVSAAARLLGKERRAFGKLLKKHGIDRSAFARG